LSRLLLVRHGDTEWSSARRFLGYSDIELNPTGLRQAERLRDRLATERINFVYSSDLRRASVTAEIIAAWHQLEVITCTELREIDYGKVEGLTFEEISRLYPEVAKLCISWSLELKFPDGESVDELNARVSKFMGRMKKHAPEQTILIVGHSAPLRLLVCHLMDMELKHWRQFRLDLASLTIVETYPQWGAILSLLNDVSHLK